MKALLRLPVWLPALIVALAHSPGARNQSSALIPPSSNVGTADDGLRLSFKDPEVVVGDRLFFETRFAHYFFERCQGNVNATLPEGDPLMSELSVATGPSLPGPFRGQSMNCRQCHLGDDFLGQRPLAGRTYCDFSRRSRIPSRADGLSLTARNSPPMINLSLPRDVPLLLHFDGEFTSAEDLTIDTLTGRNFGWLPEEAALAVAHIANVIRNDSGVNPRHVRNLTREGIPYSIVMLGTDRSIPPSLRIPSRYRLDVSRASDDQILSAIAKLMHAYMDSLRFGTHNTFRDSGSPYDRFLEKNGLPDGPDEGESGLAYAERLMRLIAQREHWSWVTTPSDGQFKLHRQRYEFGTTELQGLKIFFTRADRSPKAHVGNCITCHTPPQFTDHGLHNNGVSQAEYDATFGQGTFAALEIPGLAERNADFDAYLPATTKHPKATGRFRSAPSAGKPGFADLGVWNIFANPDVPTAQVALTEVLCRTLALTSKSCTAEGVLPLTVAYFKTPTVRDLGQSNPYFHSGALDTIEDVVGFYITTSELARSGRLRNGSHELAGVRIDSADVALLSAFLRSLNEDYR